MEARDFVQALTDWKFTQAQIEERTGIPQPTISKIARGAVDDVLSRNYRSLEAMYREEAAKRTAEGTEGQDTATEQGA